MAVESKDIGNDQPAPGETGEDDFHTRDFLFEQRILFLFRRRYIDRKIPYDEIKSVTFKKGAPLKRSRLTLAFGIGLLLLNVWIFVAAGFHLVQFFNTGLFFIAGIGAYAIYSGLPVHPVIEIKWEANSECFSVRQFIKRNATALFVAHLQKELGSSKVIVETRPVSQS